MVARKGTRKAAKAAKVEAVEVERSHVNLDEKVRENPTTGNDYQAYWRACLKAGKVL